MRTLISSQLDVDRLDYLRRDSLFTGAGYGHYDHFRLLHTFQLHDGDNGYRDLVWTDKAVYAIEEYIFSRFYMYQNVYMHKTTRGYEKLLHRLWERAQTLRSEGTDVRLLGPIDSFWRASEVTLRQFLALEEFVVLSQIQSWADHSDPALSDLARRFLHRGGFICIEGPRAENPLVDESDSWSVALTELVAKHIKYRPADAYVLRDNFETQVYSAYTPEPDTDDASPMNAIRVVRSAEEGPIEISQVLTRLQAVTNKAAETTRYYVPRELREEARKLREQWKP
jgi:HD superfamily phosphohydrolase